MLKSLIEFFTSLKLTMVLLTLALVLVFAGTLAQVEQGLYQAQARYFRSFFVYWSVGNTGWQIPVFPGGYLIGGLMLINLLAATGRRLRFAKEHVGLFLIHGGLVLLLLGQLFTDLWSVESALRFEVGETRHYSEDFHANELAVVDATQAESDRVISIPESRLQGGVPLPVPDSPLTLSVQRYWRNAQILTRSNAGAEPSGATQGVGAGLFVAGSAPATRMEERNVPAAVVEVQAGTNRLGSWLLSGYITEPQQILHEQRTWQLSLRPKRHYTPYGLTLLDCQHDVYKGTDIPRNFSSRVRILHPGTGEDREVLIYMNNPLRYGGATYYQYQMAAREAAVKSSTLQVVRNPSWLTPYVSCGLVGAGLIWQFMAHLVVFLRQRFHEK